MNFSVVLISARSTSSDICLDCSIIITYKFIFRILRTDYTMGKQNLPSVVLTFVSMATVLYVRAQTIDDTETLFKNLTSGYNKMNRPATDQRDAVERQY